MTQPASTSSSGNPFTDGKFAVANGMALVFEAMAKTDEVNKQKQQVEENPADAQIELAIDQWLQDGLNQTQDSLDALKEKLGYLMKNMGGYDENVTGWIQGLNQEANSYTVPSDLQDLLTTYQQDVAQDEENIASDNNAIQSCDNAIDTLKNKISDLKSDLDDCHWYDWLDGKAEGISIAIGDLYVALGPVYTGLGVCELQLDSDKSQLKDDQKNLDKAQQAVNADKQNFANVVAHGGQIMATQAQKTLTSYNSDIANLETVFSQSTSESNSLGQTLSELIKGSHSV